MGLNLETQDQITWKPHCILRVHNSLGILDTVCRCAVNIDFDKLIWKTWAPPTCKFFTWLAIQNRLWTADRLAARGCPNQQYCPLCMSTNESAIHLFAHCRYSKRIWEAVRSWTHGKFPSCEGWNNMDSVVQRWLTVGTSTASPCKAVRSMTLLVTWELWRERNARIFEHQYKSRTVLIAKIKEEARLWCSAGAKRLREILPMD